MSNTIPEVVIVGDPDMAAETETPVFAGPEGVRDLGAVRARCWPGSTRDAGP
jgi:hypothetical protein